MGIEKIELTPNDYNALTTNSSKKFNSTMIDIFNERSKGISPSTLLDNYQNKHNLYQPAKIDPRIYNEISNIPFNSLGKECKELVKTLK